MAPGCGDCRARHEDFVQTGLRRGLAAHRVDDGGNDLGSLHWYLSL
jgi:hypothetical protein